MYRRSYMQNNIMQNNSVLKPNYKIVYCSLKNMPQRGIGPVEINNAKNSTAFLKRSKYLEKESFW